MAVNGPTVLIGPMLAKMKVSPACVDESFESTALPQMAFFRISLTLEFRGNYTSSRLSVGVKDSQWTSSASIFLFSHLGLFGIRVWLSAKGSR